MSFGFGKSSGPTNPPEAIRFPTNNNPEPLPPRFPTFSGFRGSSVQWGHTSPPNSNNSRNATVQYTEDFIRGSGPTVQRGQTSMISRGFGGRNFPNNSQNFQDFERSRPAPVQFTDDFLSNPVESGPPVQWGQTSSINRGFGGRNSPNNSHNYPDLERSRPAPVQYTDDFLSNPMESNSDVAPNRHGHLDSQRRLSSSAVASNNSINPPASWNKYQRPALQSHTWVAPARPDSRNTGPLNERSISPPKTVGTWKSKEYSTEDEMKGSEAPFDGSRRPSVSPNSRSKSGVLGTTESQFSQRTIPSAGGMNDDSRVIKLASHSISKRSRSPSTGAGQAFQMNSHTAENDAEREEQAKAKRLARFRTELDVAEPIDSNLDGPNATQKENSRINISSPALEKKKLSGYNPSGPIEDSSQDVDNEVLQSNSVIVGLCPDMCPESERGERERKGDLDQYERLDGDRNQTSKILAVKKYTRTAEREAELIRPMPILQKTMDYLLGLLDQPYDARFLGLYNFLWDRMRAIRMDLRMQHIFNHKAITLLEQMIRLHIIAMHELCEFPKGEGFTEGFDAHLNIEQMNKTSVELFQLYDDHRKKGIFIPTEKEFRGYYALLKLDKHPGYKVEPAELSLDLAKMTPEIRQTEEVLFARDVARSCRTGNFIAFFRRARKASYHQACLMHAHFSKLRTQALASLHSGLQYNQGLPVTNVAQWLGMEGEDIESLLEYHGFIIKEFEEPYMVKDGPFLNDEKDYPTRCSILVHGKKSNTIVEDVLSSHSVVLPFDSGMELQSKKNDKNKCAAGQPVPTETPLDTSVDGEMEIEAASSPRSSIQVQSAYETFSGTQVQPLSESSFGKYLMDHQKVSTGSPRSGTKMTKAFANLREQPSPITPKHSSLVGDDGQVSSKSWNSFAVQFVPTPEPSSLGFTRQDALGGPTQRSAEIMVNPGFNASLFPGKTPGKAILTATSLSADVQEFTPLDSKTASGNGTPPQDNVLMEELSGEEVTDVQEKVGSDDVLGNYDEEVAEAKLRLLLRLWRRRFVRKKKLRDQNKLAATAALSSLSLGPPVWQNKDKPAPSQRLNIDKAVHERYGKWRQSWERWNVSEVVATKLAGNNSNSNCVCWKVVSFSWLHHGTNDIEARSSITRPSLDEWLHHKLFPAEDGILEGLTLSAPGLSVWRLWSRNHSGDLTCYFSVIKAAESGNFEKNLAGASAMLFPVSNTIQWDLQKSQLQNLVRSLPSGASIPLLILTTSGKNNSTEVSSTVGNKLGLDALDKSRVGSFLVVCLTEREENEQLHGYYSDERLKEGMMWLASEARSQPVLSCVATRELVSVHLNVRLDGLDLRDSYTVGPNQCITAFNEALDQSVLDITTACNANPTGWPCPELYLLDDSTAEFRAVKQFFPSLGWSSSEEVEPFVCALRNCKLPYMHEDLSWLSRGCNTEKDLDGQRQFLQDCLIRYLTQSSNLMHSMMAEKEASLMMQNCTRLELHDTEYKLVPSWVRIFRRVFNWQLNSSTCFSSKAYVLEQSSSVCKSRLVDMTESECPPPRYTVHPTLDEMVEVSCSPTATKRVRSSPRSMHNVPAITYGEDTTVVTLSNHLVEEADPYLQVHDQSLEIPGSDPMKGLVHKDPNDEKRDDRLVKLLDQCNMLQDAIEKKLSFYF